MSDTLAVTQRFSADVSGFTGPTWISRLIAAMLAEEADRRHWIEGVKRRLGLIEHGDDAAARMAQWERDHRWPVLPDDSPFGALVTVNARV